MGSTCSSNRTSESLQYRTEVYDPASLPWRRIRADVLRIERQQFGAGAFSVEYLEHEFVGARNTVVLLWCEDLSRLVGFTYALPVDEMDPSRGSESRITAYIGDTALDEEHQGKRLVARLMDCLERELRRKGVQFLERDASVNNGYAAKIERAYHDRIVAQSEPHESDYGPQVFFRIRL